MDHLDYIPQSNRLAARLGPPTRERVAWLKRFLPPGRTYGPVEKAWLFDVTHAAWAVAELVPQGFAPTPAFRERFPELVADPAAPGAPVLGGPAAAPASPVAPPAPPAALTVADLMHGLARAVQAAYPDRVQVAAWVGGLRRQDARGYATGELVDLDADGQPGEKLPFYLGRDALARVEARLAGIGCSLVDTLPVLVSGRVELKWGRPQLVWMDLDPAYTVGKTRLSLEQALEALQREGLAGRQAALPWPELPLRVGLIAGADGEGTRDFRRTLEESGFPFRLRLEAVRMQGDGVEPDLTAALGRLAALAPDVIAIIRGGGAGADLQRFNAPGLARAVCLCPCPVLVGIGHDHDRTLLDLVARSQRTPTAAGRLLVDTVAAAVQDRERGLRDAVGRLTSRLTAASARLDAATRTLQAVPGRLDQRAESLAVCRERLEHRWGAIVSAAARRAERDEARLRALPERLQREALRLAGAAQALAHAPAAGMARERLALAGVQQALGRAPAAGVARERLALAEMQQALGRVTTRQLQAARLALTRQPLLLEARATRLTERAGQGLALRAERLAARDPARLLAQGYALVTRPGGRLVRGAGELASGDAIRLRLADGTVTARVEEAQDGG
ncbi:MAG: exodeoxyribonuclease VII large subunit [Candidatus Sericytochromatia bacterium]|nr:exodeoxyribonuclease VII large subunit [Candidatus Sericytochromatia bacterium]